MEDGVLEEKKPFVFTWPEAVVVGIGTGTLMLLLLFSPVVFSGSTSLGMGSKIVFVLFTGTVLLLVMMCSVKCMDLHAFKNNCARLEVEVASLEAGRPFPSDGLSGGSSDSEPEEARSPSAEALGILKSHGPDHPIKLGTPNSDEDAERGGDNPSMDKPVFGSSG